MKQKMIELTLLSLAFFAISFTANASYDTELEVTLQEALMQSNADYNKHKKTSFGEEHDRIDDWGSRTDGSIMINSDQGEIDASDFAQDENDQPEQLQEISSNDT